MDHAHDVEQDFVAEALRPHAAPLGDLLLALDALQRIDIEGTRQCMSQLFSIAVEAQKLLVVIDGYKIGDQKPPILWRKRWNAARKQLLTRVGGLRVALSDFQL